MRVYLPFIQLEIGLKKHKENFLFHPGKFGRPAMTEHKCVKVLSQRFSIDKCREKKKIGNQLVITLAAKMNADIGWERRNFDQFHIK